MEKYTKENAFSFYDWDVKYFSTAAPLNEYLPCLQNHFIGRKLVGFHAMGCIFNNYDDVPLEHWETDRVETDEAVVLDFEGIHLDLWVQNTSVMKIGINSLTMKEESYQCENWSDFSLLLPRVLNQTLTRIIVKTTHNGFYDSLDYGLRPDGGDYIAGLLLVFDNRFALSVYGSLEYMNLQLLEPWSYFEAPDTGERYYPCYKYIAYKDDRQIEDAELSLRGDLPILFNDILSDLYANDHSRENGLENIPIDLWKKAVTYLSAFYSANDYEMFVRSIKQDPNFSLIDSEVLWSFEYHGQKYWDRRALSLPALKVLTAWTAKYEMVCDNVR